MPHTKKIIAYRHLQLSKINKYFKFLDKIKK